MSVAALVPPDKTMARLTILLALTTCVALSAAGTPGTLPKGGSACSLYRFDSRGHLRNRTSTCAAPNVFFSTREQMLMPFSTQAEENVRSRWC